MPQRSKQRIHIGGTVDVKLDTEIRELMKDLVIETGITIHKSRVLEVTLKYGLKHKDEIKETLKKQFT